MFSNCFHKRQGGGIAPNNPRWSCHRPGTPWFCYLACSKKTVQHATSFRFRSHDINWHRFPSICGMMLFWNLGMYWFHSFNTNMSCVLSAGPRSLSSLSWEVKREHFDSVLGHMCLCEVPLCPEQSWASVPPWFCRDKFLNVDHPENSGRFGCAHSSLNIPLSSVQPLSTYSDSYRQHIHSHHRTVQPGATRCPIQIWLVVCPTCASNLARGKQIYKLHHQMTSNAALHCACCDFWVLMRKSSKNYLRISKPLFHAPEFRLKWTILDIWKVSRTTLG